MALLPSLKRTKIVVTVGPASDDFDAMQAMVRAGANCIRLNMSHSTPEESALVVKQARSISTKLNKPLAIIVDLQGPKIRLGQLPAEGLVLRAGSELTFAYGDSYSEGKPIPVQHDIAKYVKAGQPLFLRDGMVEIRVAKVRGGVISGKVLNNGMVYSKQGINLPDTDFGGDIITPKDIEDIAFAAAHDVDYVALSFVQKAKDIQGLRQRLRRLNADCGIIAKIETKVAVANLREIIQAADGVMVARGDLAVETKPEQVPIIQKQIIDYARECQKPAIVATQMLESMINAPQPTRAEVSDVSTAVVQGADAVMLSGESAVGKYPVEAVALMRRIITYTEANRFDSIAATSFGDQTQSNAISAAAITLANQIGARLILAETSSGQTARNLCSFRPEPLIVAVTHQARVYNQMALMWGTRSYLVKNPAKVTEEVIRMLRQELGVTQGEVIIRASGKNPGVAGGTDTLRIEVI
ncbi:MAG TPA: pyruvate kinase [Candidatus Saccharimonadales bacterium]|nr:pyruvate kinase [Candidatus Saccharimonadales bacterium]